MKNITDEQKEFAEVVKEGLIAADEAFGNILTKASETFPLQYFAILVGVEVKKLTGIQNRIQEYFSAERLASVQLGIDIFVSMTSKLSKEEASEQILDQIHRMDEMEEQRRCGNGSKS